MVVLFQEMARKLDEIDSRALVIALSALSKTSDLEKGRAVHCVALKLGFGSDTCLCNVLVDLYAKGGDLASSECVFEGVESKDVVTWNSVIRGCLCNGFREKAVSYFRKMRFWGSQFDRVTLSCMLPACSSSIDQSYSGELVHGLAVKLGYASSTSVANSLISFYSRSFDMEAAEQVFRDHDQKNAVSWNSVINGWVQNGRHDEAFFLFHEMQSTTTIRPDSVTVISLLQLCAESVLLLKGMEVHGFVIRRQLETQNLSVMNGLIDMYVKCHDLTSASILFRTMPSRDIISWNTVISGYSHSERLKEEAWLIFCELLQTGLRCSVGTILGILPSFNQLEDLHLGKSVHCWMLKYGLGSVSAVNALMLMYMNCADLPSSSSLFKSILHMSDVISWNTVIVGCVQNGYCKDAIGVFMLMLQNFHAKPDAITLVNVLSACGHLEQLFLGKCLHGLVLKTMTGSQVRASNALITMYSRCGDVESSEFIFQECRVKNVCSWNCMISCYVQNNQSIKAMELFQTMGISQADQITMVALLCACAQLGALRQGMQVHGRVLRVAAHHNTYICASLVDMYGKCGRLDTALRVFRRIVDKSVVSWNSIILVFGFHGYGREASNLFLEMCEMGIKPTKSTFISILSACSHSGLIVEGRKYFDLMTERYGIEPTIEHCVCVVDMLGRAGRLREAHEFIRRMPVDPEPGIWGALLSACVDQRNLEMGRPIAEHLFRYEPDNVGYYVSYSNLCAASGRWSDAVELRDQIVRRGLAKPLGCSFIDAPVTCR